MKVRDGWNLQFLKPEVLGGHADFVRIIKGLGGLL